MVKIISSDIVATKLYRISKYQDDKYKFNYYFGKFPKDLFEKIKMDEVASFSVTEANFADIISELILKVSNITKNMSIVDATACVGGNSISFSPKLFAFPK